jgi:hypothetical protein
VLVFPFFILLCVAAFQLALLALQQLDLNRSCLRVARLLAQSPSASTSTLAVEARQYLRNKEPLRINVVVRTLPSRPVRSPYRAPKSVDIIELSLMKLSHGLTLTSHVNEARVRSREAVP